MAMGDTMGKFNFKSRENRHELEFEGAPGYVPEYRPPRYWPPLYGPQEVRTNSQIGGGEDFAAEREQFPATAIPLSQRPGPC